MRLIIDASIISPILIIKAFQTMPRDKETTH